MSAADNEPQKNRFRTHRKLGIAIWIGSALLIVFYELSLLLLKLFQG